LTRLAGGTVAMGNRRICWLVRGTRCLLLAGFVLAAAWPGVAGQSKDSSSDLRPFVGTWTASINGNVFAILTLKVEKGEIAGTMNNFDISVDKDGNLTDSTHKDTGESPLFNARVKDGTLSFLVVEKDAYSQPAKWKFVPRSADEAELDVVLDDQINAPPDMVIKPIRMVRQHAKN
jgi:hypothetical protein